MIHSQGIKRLSVDSVIVLAHWGFLSDYNSTEVVQPVWPPPLATCSHILPGWLHGHGWLHTGHVWPHTTHRAVKEVNILVERLHWKSNMIVFDTLMLIC